MTASLLVWTSSHPNSLTAPSNTLLDILITYTSSVYSLPCHKMTTSHEFLQCGPTQQPVENYHIGVWRRRILRLYIAILWGCPIETKNKNRTPWSCKRALTLLRDLIWMDFHNGEGTALKKLRSFDVNFSVQYPTIRLHQWNKNNTRPWAQYLHRMTLVRSFDNRGLY